MVEKATSWIGRAVGRVFSAIIEGLLALWRWVQNSPLGKAAGALGLGTAAAGMSGVDAVRGIVEPFVNRLATAGSDIAAAFSPLKAAKDAWKQIGLDTQRDVAVRQAARREKERTDVGDQRDKQPYNDFRGSKFDITQKFAEGFDPDRIAVAFANDLAMMGERKLQSGFSPIYAAT
jgi:hypothetical protein